MFTFELSVRGYELDSYHHVNHASYLQYMEHARWEILRETGLLEELLSAGSKLVIVKAEVRYIRELKLFDQVIISTRIKKEAPYLTFFHQVKIKKDDLMAARASIKTILLDKTGSVTDFPEKYLKKTEHYQNIK